jgi:hypothetical protein
MTTLTVPETEIELRWRKWMERGAEGDRRTAKHMRGMLMLIAAVFLLFAIVQLN